jgi:hypothetical protein
MMRAPYSRRSSRQATVELLLGIVALAVVAVAIAQFGRTGHESILNLIRAREQAERAMLTSGPGLSGGIGDWSDGPDALAYTADDATLPSLAGGGLFADTLTTPLDLRAIESDGAYGFRMRFTDALQGGSFVLAADLREGRSRTTIPLENALRLLLSARGTERLTLRDTAAMPGVRLDD